MPPSAPSNLVLAAFLLNAAFGGGKLVAAALTGSGALLAEFIHSIATATSMALILVAMRRPPRGRDPKAVRREWHFWSLVVPILIYSLGAGVALNEGTSWLQAPRVLSDLPTGLVTLSAMLALQAGLAIVIARQSHAVVPVDRIVHDTLVVTSMAAVAGIGATLAALAAAHVFGTAESDALAAVVVVLIMGAVAATMAIRTRALLATVTAGALAAPAESSRSAASMASAVAPSADGQPLGKTPPETPPPGTSAPAPTSHPRPKRRKRHGR
ncbi:MAG: cation transporter [Hyphomicrobiaceae bacterium]